MYYDSRIITCSFRTDKTKDFIQYGHIIDSGNIYKTKTNTETGTATCYWNHSWIVSGFRFKLKLTNYTGSNKAIYFVIYSSPNSSTVTQQGTTFMKIDKTNVTFQYGTSSFEHLGSNAAIISFPHRQDLFKEDLDIFFGIDKFVSKSGKIVPDYFFAINGTKYMRTDSQDRQNWTLDMIPAYTRTTNSFNYGYFADGMTADAYFVLIYGSSPLGYISSFYNNVEPWQAEPEDIFYLWPAYACFHIYTSSSIHNHTKDSQESASDRATGGFDKISGYRKFSNRYEDTPLFFPNQKAANNSWKYNKLGAESFSLVTAGIFPSGNTERRVVFRIFEGTVTPGPEYSGSNLRLRLILDQVRGILYLWVSNTNPDNLWVKESTVNIFWHPLIRDRFQFSIHYEHEQSKISVCSKIMNKAVISENTALGQDYKLLEISGLSWQERKNCFYSWGENDIANSGTTQISSTCWLTDFFCTGETSKFTAMKIVFSLSGDIEDPVKELALLSGEPTDIFVLHTVDPDSFSAEKRALYSSTELAKFQNVKITLAYDHSKLSLEDKGNGRYILTVLKSGTHEITASYTSPDQNLISDFSTKISVFCKITPEMSVTYEKADYITDTGTGGINSLSIKAGHDFSVTLISNIDRPPDNILGDLELSGPITGTQGNNYTYTYEISSLTASTAYEIEFSYTETERNEEGSCFLSIECEDNREKVFMKIYSDSELTTALSTISLNLPAKTDIHVPVPTGAEVDCKKFYVATTIPTAPDSKFSSNSVSLSREPLFTITKDGQRLYIYPYTVTAISEKGLMICSFYYEETEVRASGLATLRISVTAPTSLAATDTGERGALISLTKKGDNWQTSLIMSSSGEKILEEPVTVSSSMKAALISFANELTTGGA